MEGYQDYLKGEVRYLSLAMKNPGESCKAVRKERERIQGKIRVFKEAG